MTDEDQEVAGGWLDHWFPSGVAGTAAHLVIGKAASRAIGRLIGSAADIPVAGMENIAQRFRSDTEGRKRVQHSLSIAAAKAVPDNQAIASRALEYWAGKQITRQENRESVGKRVVEDLLENPLPSGEGIGPTEDFMNLFSDYAERASSDSLRDLFSRVLLGEIRKPGSVSLQTLQLISVIDQSLAQSIQKARGWIASGVIIPADIVCFGENFLVLSQLHHAAILDVGQVEFRPRFDEKGEIILAYHQHGIVITGTPGEEVKLGIYPLTRVGLELMNLLPPCDDVEVIRETANHMKAREKLPTSEFFKTITIQKVEIVVVEPSVQTGGLIRSRVEI